MQGFNDLAKMMAGTIALIVAGLTLTCVVFVPVVGLMWFVYVAWSWSWVAGVGAIFLSVLFCITAIACVKSIAEYAEQKQRERREAALGRLTPRARREAEMLLNEHASRELMNGIRGRTSVQPVAPEQGPTEGSGVQAPSGPPDRGQRDIDV